MESLSGMTCPRRVPYVMGTSCRQVAVAAANAGYLAARASRAARAADLPVVC